MNNMNVKEAYIVLQLSPGSKLKEVVKNYKRLALEWYPQKHSYSALANEKFKQISHAYRLLATGEKPSDSLSMSEMISLFEEVFIKNKTNIDCEDSADDEYSEDSYSYDDEEDDEENFTHKLETVAQIIGRNQAKEDRANMNGKLLVEQEEKEKKKAQKRKEKKKKRKQKLKQEKVQANQKTTGDSSKQRENKSAPSDTSGTEEEGLDPNSAFVANAVSKSGLNANTIHASSIGDHNKSLNHSRRTPNEEETARNLDPVILQSRQLAIRGNELASVGAYQEAIELFTNAIKIDPRDYRYFGNRAYCYDRTVQYDRSLKDAERSISLCPIWPKGHFRKGRALTGLKRYAEAEVCFQEVIKLDKNCPEAFQELLAARTAGIMEMGFSQQLAETTAIKYDSLESAVNALVLQSIKSSPSSASNQDVYASDEESSQTPRVQYQIKNLQSSDDKMDSRNLHKQTSLWVGNLNKEGTEKLVTNLFSKFGDLMSVRVLPESRCAFINYKTAQSASRAMDGLQGYEYFGERLLIRFPDHQHSIGGNTVLKKKNLVLPGVKKNLAYDFKGPVNGDECFFWRNAGCLHGDKCRYRHIPKHKGVDLK